MRIGEKKNPWYGSSFLVPDAFLTSLRNIAVSDLLIPDREKKKVSVLGFKEIRYNRNHFNSYDEMLDYIVFLTKLFPGLKILGNIRNPEDTAKSGWWANSDKAIQTITEALEWLTRLPNDLEERCGRSVMYCVSYEDWSKDYLKLKPAWDFLQLPWVDETMKVGTAERLLHMKDIGYSDKT